MTDSIKDYFPTWDSLQKNIGMPSQTLIDNGYPEDAIPTSPETNWLLNKLTLLRRTPGRLCYFVYSGEVEGYVSCSGKTLGSASSAAYYKDDKYGMLFEYLWEKFPDQAKVSPSKGASANSDWVANKTIVVPLFTDTILASVSPKSGSIFKTRLSVLVGENEQPLSVDNIGPHTHTYSRPSNPASFHSSDGNVPFVEGSNLVETSSTGTGTSPTHNNIQPTMALSFKFKW